MKKDLYIKTEDMVTPELELDYAKFGKVLTYFDRFIENLSGPVFYWITRYVFIPVCVGTFGWLV